MAHTDRDDDAPKGIIQQKPPPPPARGPAPDPVPEPIIPQKPPPPPARAPSQDEFTPAPEAPAETAPRRQSSPPASRRRKPSGHLVIPAGAADIDPLIIDRAGTRPRMGSAPMMLIDYPRLHRPSLTSVR